MNEIEKGLNMIRRYIAETSIQGIDIQDIFQTLQQTNWDDWVNEAKLRIWPVIACVRCSHNTVADMAKISSQGHLCDQCANHREVMPPVPCRSCGKLHAPGELVKLEMPTNTPRHTKLVWSCPDKVEETIDRHSVPCMRCNARYLPYSSRRLCDSCYVPKYIKEANRVSNHNQRVRDLELASGLTLSQWLATLDYFEWRCAYCKGNFTEIEHFLPISLNGGTTANNCLPSCQRCNNRKNDRHPDKLDSIFPAENLARIRQYLSEQSA